MKVVTRDLTYQTAKKEHIYSEISTNLHPSRPCYTRSVLRRCDTCDACRHHMQVKRVPCAAAAAAKCERDDYERERERERERKDDLTKGFVSPIMASLSFQMKTRPCLGSKTMSVSSTRLFLPPSLLRIASLRLFPNGKNYPKPR